jgi:hypothetical protein
MPSEGTGRIYRAGKYKTLIHVHQDIVHDSAFPFELGEDVRIRIDAKNKRLIIERAD